MTQLDINLKMSKCARVIHQHPLDMPRMTPSPNDLLLKVAKGEVGDHTPVWLMRQAGRYMFLGRNVIGLFVLVVVVAVAVAVVVVVVVVDVVVLLLLMLLLLL